MFDLQASASSIVSSAKGFPLGSTFHPQSAHQNSTVTLVKGAPSCLAL